MGQTAARGTAVLLSQKTYRFLRLLACGRKNICSYSYCYKTKADLICFYRLPGLITAGCNLCHWESNSILLHSIGTRVRTFLWRSCVYLILYALWKVNREGMLSYRRAGHVKACESHCYDNLTSLWMCVFFLVVCHLQLRVSSWSHRPSALSTITGHSYRLTWKNQF